MARLGVNIDHVATLRQLRGTEYPSVVDAANICLQEGADQITIHLREDRRHIQDTDVEAVRLVTKKFGRPLNLEMGCNPEIVEVALATGPDWVCLVPEKRQELTTEGGLNLLDAQVFGRIKDTCEKLRATLTPPKISLFLEGNPQILQKALELKPEAIEIHTGEYSRSFMEGEDYDEQLEVFRLAVKFLKEHNIKAHAGHGLTIESVRPLASEKLFEEYNIGHWIICQALFQGLGPTVRELKYAVVTSGEKKA
ncbi:MAG: pyridoxine 5'-phosphate synthase [Pseudomonadota bacterium]